MTATVSPADAGHPLWHFAVFAVGAIVVFAVITLSERWNQHQLDAAPPSPVRPTKMTVAVCWLALASTGAATVHALVGPAHFREAQLYGIFFLAVAAAQGAWAALILLRPTRSALIAGGIANTGVVLIWIMSRTTGLPFGPEPWQPEAFGLIDTLASTLEISIVALTARHALARGGSGSLMQDLVRDVTGRASYTAYDQA